MCSRLEAIKIIVKETKGTKGHLIAKIGPRNYYSFVRVGYIAELKPLPGGLKESHAGSSSTTKWVVTESAIKQDKFYRLVAPSYGR